MKEKDVLLKEIDRNFKLNSTEIKKILIILLLSMVFLFAAMLKIWISNQIYLTSIKINKKIGLLNRLKSENQILNSKLNKLKFQNRLNMNVNFNQK